jgi:hypothetical protein
MNDTLKRLRLIVKDKAAEMGWEPDDVLALAAAAFARGNPLLDADKLKPFQEYSKLTGKPVEDLVEAAMDNYAECDLAALLEELAERSGKG